jgi:hypothetical protein
VLLAVIDEIAIVPLRETSLLSGAASWNIRRISTGRRLQVDPAEDAVCGKCQVVNNGSAGKASLETAVFDELIDTASN